MKAMGEQRAIKEAFTHLQQRPNWQNNKSQPMDQSIVINQEMKRLNHFKVRGL